MTGRYVKTYANTDNIGGLDRDLYLFRETKGHKDYSIGDEKDYSSWGDDRYRRSYCTKDDSKQLYNRNYHPHSYREQNFFKRGGEHDYHGYMNRKHPPQHYFSHWDNWDSKQWKREKEWKMLCDIGETDYFWIVRAEIPGVRKDNVMVKVEGKDLIIKGKKLKEESCWHADKLCFSQSSGNMPRVCSNHNCSCGSNCTCGSSCKCGSTTALPSEQQGDLGFNKHGEEDSGSMKRVCSNHNCSCGSSCTCGPSCKCGSSTALPSERKGDLGFNKHDEAAAAMKRVCGNHNCSCGSSCTCGPSCKCGSTTALPSERKGDLGFNKRDEDSGSMKRVCSNHNCSCGSSCTCGPSCKCGSTTALPSERKGDLGLNKLGTRMVVKWHTKERGNKGTFKRKIHFPQRIDHTMVDALYKDGMVEVVVKKNTFGKAKKTGASTVPVN